MFKKNFFLDLTPSPASGFLSGPSPREAKIHFTQKPPLGEVVSEANRRGLF